MVRNSGNNGRLQAVCTGELACVIFLFNIVLSFYSVSPCILSVRQNVHERISQGYLWCAIHHPICDALC